VGKDGWHFFVGAVKMAEEMLLSRVPPQDLGAELAVLGSILLDNGVTGEVLQTLQGDDFYRSDNRQIFTSLVELYDDNQRIDLVILRDYLKKKGLLDEVGGVAKLTELLEATPTAANAVYYAGIVKEKALLRRLIAAATEVMRSAFDETDESADALLDNAERLIFEIAESRVKVETVKIKDIMQEVWKRIDQIHDRKGRLTGLDTGFYDLNDLTGGLQNSELIILAGRPSMGKTSFALNMAEYVGVTLEKALVFFSMEMSKEQLIQNMICSRARISSNKIRKGAVSVEEMKKLLMAAGRLAEAPIFIDDSSALGLLELRAKARRLKAQEKIALIIVDYLQLMQPPRAENRQQEIAAISRGLKSLARELGVPVLAVSQLSRAPEAREGHKPRLSDLRESGALEQDADVVILLYRDEYYDPDTMDKGIAEVNVAKQRNGPAGMKPIRLAFQPEFTRFQNLSTMAGAVEE
jgi:replicative DNA helicase